MVWDTTNKEEHIVKYQKRSFANGVFDISWTEDSKRICVVGNGKEQYAESFLLQFFYHFYIYIAKLKPSCGILVALLVKLVDILNQSLVALSVPSAPIVSLPAERIAP